MKPPLSMATSLAAGRGKTVTPLGAGVSGLCAAYERAGGGRLTLPCGDALGWQEGAVLTAWSTVITIDCQRR